MKVIVGPSPGGKVSVRRHFEGAEILPGEYVADIPEDQHAPLWAEERIWDSTTNVARLPAASEIIEEKREETKERLAGEAEAANRDIFVNHLEVLGLVASVAKRLVANAPAGTVSAEEQAVLDHLHNQYLHSLAKKAEVDTTDPNLLDAIVW